MESGGFFGDNGGVFQQIEGLDEFVALQGVLAAKTIGIGTFLNLFALKRSGGDSTAGNYLALVNARADAGGKPGIDFAELHVGFGEGDTFDATHFGVGGEQESDLSFEGNLEGVFAKRALPTVDVGLFGSECYFAAFS